MAGEGTVLALRRGYGLVGAAPYDPLVSLGDDLLEGWDAKLWPETLTLNGNEVVTWASKITPGLAPTQAAQAARPLLYPTNFIGGPCVVADGVDDVLSIGAVASNMPTGSATCELHIIGSQDTAGGSAAGTRLFEWGDGGSAGLFRGVGRSRVVSPSNHVVSRSGVSTPSTVTFTGTSDTFSGPFYVRIRWEANRQLMWLNGVSQGEIAMDVFGTTNTRTRFFAGAASTPLNFWLGSLQAHYVTKLLSGSKEVALVNYMMQRAGFS